MTVERSELETCQRLNKKIDQLEAELVSAKTKIEQEVAQRHHLGRCMDVSSVECCESLHAFLSVTGQIPYTTVRFLLFHIVALCQKCKTSKLHSIPNSIDPGCNHLFFHICAFQARLLEAKKQLETQNKLYLKTKELLLTSEKQVATLKVKLAAASSSETVGATGLKLQLRGKQ